MATIEQLANALRKADAAGDTEGARKLAGAIRNMRTGGEKPQVGTAEDMVRSGVAGVGQGAVGLAAFPADMRAFGRSVVESGALNGGASPEQAQASGSLAQQALSKIPGLVFPAFNALSNGPTSQEALSAINDLTRPAPNASQLVTGEQPKAPLEYEPQTTAGKYTRTVGQFVPGMALGPGGAARNVVSGLGAAVASETAGQATEGTGYEPYARFGAALAGGGLPMLKGPAKAPLSSTKELKNEAHAAYKAAEQSGSVLPAADYSQILDRIGQMAVDEGAGRMTPRLRSAMKELVANEGRDLSVREVDRMRQNLRFGIDAMKPDEARIIKKMVAEFDNAVEQLAPSPIAEARAKWRVAKKAETLDSLESKAELKAGQYTQSGMENARRTVYRQLASNDRKMKQFSPEEQAAIRKVATGNGIENAARNLGKYAPTGPVPAMTSILAGIGGGSFFGPAGSTVGGLIGTGLAGTGIAAKLVAQGMSKTNARIVEELVRGGKATTQSPDKKMLETIARMLIQGREASASP